MLADTILGGCTSLRHDAFAENCRYNARDETMLSDYT